MQNEIAQTLVGYQYEGDHDYVPYRDIGAVKFSDDDEPTYNVELIASFVRETIDDRAHQIIDWEDGPFDEEGRANAAAFLELKGEEREAVIDAAIALCIPAED